MLLVAPVNESKRKKLNGEELHLQGIEKLKLPRSSVPAIPTSTIRLVSRRSTATARPLPQARRGVRAQDRLPGHHQHELQRAR
jgi:hypothetical protein